MVLTNPFTLEDITAILVAVDDPNKHSTLLGVLVLGQRALVQDLSRANQAVQLTVYRRRCAPESG